MNTREFYASEKEAEKSFTHLMLFCAIAFFVSRVALNALGMIVYLLNEPIITDSTINPVSVLTHLHNNRWLDLWLSWDSSWYLSIANDGYQLQPFGENNVRAGQANWAFFPLYPFMAKGISLVTGLESGLSLIILANVSFLTALPLIWLEARDSFDVQTADASVWLFAIMPSTFFFSAGYTESLFLLLAVASMRLSRNKQFIWAGIFALLATLTRNLGLFLVLPMAFYGLQDVIKRWQPHHLISDLLKFSLTKKGVTLLLAGLLPALGIVGLMVFFNKHIGDPLAFVNIQEAWGRPFQNPLYTLVEPIFDTNNLRMQPHAYIFMLLGMPLLAILALNKQWAYFLFALPLCVLPLTKSFLSFHRYLIVIYPFVILVSHLIIDGTKKERLIRWGLIILMSGYMMYAWTTGRSIY